MLDIDDDHEGDADEGDEEMMTVELIPWTKWLW
jgi:hypothetical protein